MERFGSTLLFGKYQLCRLLGRGRSGTVYLAKHKELEEYRAIKKVPKSQIDYAQFRKEALILKDIRHPGIPIVYDLEEDEDFCYLIEEYLEGDSLYALVSDMGHFSKAMTVRYGIQICHLVSVLHSASPIPILYLDLQPKNLLVCDDTVKLVDFDHAIYLEEAEHLTKRYGTVGCAAPEQYTGGKLNEHTDIYAIGAVLYYMLTGEFPGSNPVYPGEQISRCLAKVIRTCLRKEPECRYESADRLRKDLENIQGQIDKKEKGVFRKNQEISLSIAVAGASRGAGTTHMAISLVAYFRQKGLSALYEERNDSGAVRQMADCAGCTMDQYGIYRIYGLPVLPLYGDVVKLNPHPYRVVVRDYGISQEAFAQEPADGYLLVCGSKPWQWKFARNAVQFPGNPPGMAVIYNQFCRRLTVRLPGPAKGTESFLMPDSPNPFVCTKQVKRVFDEVFRMLSGEQTGGIIRRFLDIKGCL
ncbi:MAG: serine/threonine protein kinase [Lachnospiraceae bacterium]|nr:serine/threonine protein kinase [Lachnospiraceae bacterium]